MFDNFTFEASARRVPLPYRASSPCDTTLSSPPLPPRMVQGDFEIASTSHLASPSYEPQPPRDDISSSYIPYSLPGTPVASNHEDLLTIDNGPERRSVSAPPSLLVLSHSHLPAPRICRRLQRQINTQLLSTQSHLMSLSALLDEMVSSEIQCEVRVPSPLPPSQPRQSTAPPPTSLPILADPAAVAPLSSAESALPALMPASESEILAIELPLEVDEGFQDGDDEELDMEAMLQNFRRAQDRPDARKFGYPTATVVYNRPRMRKKISRRKRGDEVF